MIVMLFNSSVDDNIVVWLFSVFGGSVVSIDLVWIECFCSLLFIFMIFIYSWFDGLVVWEVCCYDKYFSFV